MGVKEYRIFRDGVEIAAVDMNQFAVNGTVCSTVFTKDSSVVEEDVYAVDKTTSLERLNENELNSVKTNYYSDTGLSPDTEYCYCVSACDACGNESSRCSPVCAITPNETPCGVGLPLEISDLDFPSIVTAGSSIEGYVDYQGSYDDINNPVMALRFPTESGYVISYVLTPAPKATNDCRIHFTAAIPDEISGVGTTYFKLVDYDPDEDDNWNNNGVSNQLSKWITIDDGGCGEIR